MASKTSEKFVQIWNKMKAIVKKENLNKVKTSAANGVKKAGAAVVSACGFTAQSLKGVFAFCGEKVSKAFSGILAAAVPPVREALLRFWKGFSKPFIKMGRAPKLLKNAFSKDGVKGAGTVLLKGTWNNRNFFTTILNYAAPVFGIMVLCYTVASASNITYALDLSADGQHVGYAENEAAVTNAEEELRQRIVHTDADAATFAINSKVKITPVNTALVSTVDRLADNLIKMSDEEVCQAEGLYIDGTFYGALTEKGILQAELDAILAQYRTGAEGETAEFVRDIEVRDGLFLTESLVDADEMKTLLHSTEESKVTYTIVEGDSPLLIANKNGIPYSQLKALNPDIETDCFVDQEVLIAAEAPFLSVKTVREETYTQQIAYKTETIKDSSQYKGYSSVKQEGENGEKEITASVEYVNGVESGRTVLSAKVTKEPVNKQVVEGTKEKPVYTYTPPLPGSVGNGYASGSYIWPVGGNGGGISQYYSGYHPALDIYTGYGTPIRASASGTVILAGWYDSYGLCVIIDHGNGVQTLYAHNSSLNVSAGQYVSQGQTIAGAGSTGYSTGVHCHFEFRINGSRYNPLNYMGK